MRYFELNENKIVVLEYSTKGKSKAEIDEMLHRLRRIVQTSDFIGERDNAQALINKILAELDRPAEEPQQREEPKTATDSVTGAFKVVFFGHFYDPMAGKRGSDKVWGWGVKDNYIYQFWGANGKSPQVKRMPNTDENRNKVNDLARKKAAKGYDKISASNHQEWLKTVLTKQPKFDG